MKHALVQKDAVPGISPEIYSPRDFAAVSEIVYSRVGIVLAEGKALLVYSRLAPRVRETGAVTFANYVELLRDDEVELNRALASLTTNHTFFYREAHHFEHFEEHTRPNLIANLNRRVPVRMWSAGCSSGEEVYSLIMTMLGTDRIAGQSIARGDLKVLASDIAPHALAKAEAAVYEAKDLKPVPNELREAWTSKAGDEVTISPVARSLVRFRSLNLLGDWPMAGKFDVIFCRNVMIYFDQPTKERLISRFLDALKPDGLLYIGHSERVTGPAADRVQLVGPTVYRRRLP
ncbi:CheR family methyltransferase [Novosphingobium aquimarinum]|uniref:CheR family methyltransferase n=1 Tax=Novosphingobium aquimarinum TaxID=2682494 RepID=UPI0012EB71E0|nr:protein-glutamate O-methyltransferase [Novosphingobium aquimarinum]